MKKITLLILAILVGFSLAACGTMVKAVEKAVSDKQASEENGEGEDGGEAGAALQTITSAESSLTLSFPKAWKVYHGELHDDASIEIANPAKEQYMIVLEESAEDFVEGFNVDDYLEIFLEGMVEGIDLEVEPVIQPAKFGKDGLDARQARMSGAVDSIKVEYFLVCAEVNGIFYQVIAWSLPSRFDAAKPLYDEVIASATF